MTPYGLTSDADRIAACLDLLRKRCEHDKEFVTGDGRVGEGTTSKLLGLAPGTLANMRADGSGPTWYRLGGGGHRVTYRLDDIAAWIEAARCNL